MTTFNTTSYLDRWTIEPKYFQSQTVIWISLVWRKVCQYWL